LIPVPVEEFATWLGGTAQGFPPAATVDAFALDSNQVKPGDLFLAIKGERADGHDFVAKAMENGAIGAIVERPVQAPHILVPNLVQALAKMALRYRMQFVGPVVAITGSAGKTSTKEFAAAALAPLGLVLKTSGNRNTEYTVPLIWTEYDSTQITAVVEMSMRGFGQIRHLASFSRPSIAVITNIGYAHMEMVNNRQGIADAKGELLDALPKNGIAIVWYEDDFKAALRAKCSGPVYTFGFDPEATCRITSYRPTTWTSSTVIGTCFGHAWRAEMPAVGRHMALNCAAAVLTAAVVGVEPAVAASHIQDAQLPPLRMQVIEKHKATILLDTYNASPPSMIAAIETLSQLPIEGRRLAVLGDMRELGSYTADAHREVAQVVANAKFDRVILYGAEMARVATMIGSAEVATSLTDVERFLSTVMPGDAVLIKGSRSLELERALGEGAVH